MSRLFPRPIKRIVIKLGSSVIATYRMKPRKARLRSLVDQICSVVGGGVDVVVVSSGAIVLGMGELNRRTRASDLPSLQTLAAIGQIKLMNEYTTLFKRNKKMCAQVLLTWDDFDNRHRFNNARTTLNKMFDWGIVPVINENDAISTDEIRFGDNDRLSALVASLVHADLLLILSDVEGFYDLSGKKKKILEEIKDVTPEIINLARPTQNKQMAKGGMISKLDAVKIATHAKVPCIIAHGETEDVLLRVLKGERIGTLFVEKEDRLLSRKHWISFGAKPKGVLVVDEGAKKALQKGGVSLLLPGVVAWEGNFKKNDVVVVSDQSRHEIARGIVNYASIDLNKIEDKKGKPEAIHCNNMVLGER